MLPIVKTLLTDSSGQSCIELVEILLRTDDLRIEKIASHGQPSPAGFWYDQPQPEWVALLIGTATLAFIDEAPLELIAGDSLLIPAHHKHRVERTSKDAIWLAVHFRQEP